MSPWVVDLEDSVAADRSLVGGKAAGLNRLIRGGLAVPRGFVVTAEAFRAHFPGASTSPPSERPTLDPVLTRAIGDAMASRFPADAVLAVRSSALGEDSAHASHAGQHATYYHILAHGVAEAVVDCWLSLWSIQAQSYRDRHDNEADTNVVMAVIIQRMVRAECSGVCFTRDPTGTHDGDALVIEATWGLGAALVDGRVSPDRLVLDRDGRVLHHHVARKRQRVSAVAGNAGDTRLEPVPAREQTRPVLSPAQAGEVARASLAAENVCGAPQDVEWSYEDGNLYLLQSRPVTTLPAATTPPGTDQWVLFKPLAENFTEPLTPMTVDLLRRVLPRGGRFIDGRYYLNLDTAHRVCPLRWSRRELADAMLLRGEVPPLRWDWRKLPLTAAGLVVAYLLDGIAWHRTAHLTRESLDQFEQICDRVRDDPSFDALETFQRLVFGRGPLEPIGRVAFYVNVSSGRYFLLLGLLTRLLARWAPAFDSHLLAALCGPDGGTWSRRLVEGVQALATVARRDPDLARRLTSPDGNRPPTATVAALPDDHPFCQALRTFLDAFGHRATREMELAAPRWREDPLPLLLMIRGYLRSPVPAAASVATDMHARQLLARDSLRRALPRRWKWRLADFLVRRVRYYVSLREDSRHYHAMAMDTTRAKLLEMETGLLASGRLKLPGDLFYLTWVEARSLRTGSLTWQDVAVRVRQRRQRERLATRAGTPEAVTGTTSSAQTPTSNGQALDTGASPSAAGAGEVLDGHCASPGTAEGHVRIVLDPAATHDLQAGDVLVAPYTDPAWTPLFPLAAAVVVEVGSFLSHAGTLAREYGIPCVVDVAHCTRRLRDGQRVRVLASEGRVEVLEP